MQPLILPDDFMEQGCFVMPRVLYDQRLGLKKYDRLLLGALFNAEDEFLKDQKGEWFFMTNARLALQTGLSLRQIPHSRQRLRDMGFIESRPGHTRRATEYRIRLDHFYRYWREGQCKTDTPLKSSDYG